MTTVPAGLHVAINGWFAGVQAAGSGQYVDHLLAALPQVGAEVRWSLLVPRRAETRLPEWLGVATVSLRLPPLPANLAKLWWEQVTIPRAARRLGADVLWVPYWAAPWWQPVSTVVTVHDLIPLLLPAYRGGMLQRGYTRLVSTTARRATEVIAVSAASARDAAEYLDIPPAHIHVVHHGPNQEGFVPPADRLATVRQTYGLPDRFFLYLGGFDVRKNVQATMAAYRRYLDRGGDPAVKLVLAGRLPGASSAFFPDPQILAAELELGGQVLFIGWVGEADKPALYRLATAFVFPSLYEGFGMMVLEAMQAGTPVITSGKQSVIRQDEQD
jgi:glycosyltransferase involved in cell wall biosynthesis